MPVPGPKILAASLALLLCGHFAAGLVAQEAYKVADIKEPRCDLSEVPPIDPGAPFASALQKNPDARGAIVVYGLEGYAVWYARQIQGRMNDYSGVEAARLTTLYGGHEEDLRMQLWVIPKGAAEPKSDFVEDTKSARKFDEYSYWSGEICGGHRGPALFAFGEALRRRPGWRGYIIVRPHRYRRGEKLPYEGSGPWSFVSGRWARLRAARDRSFIVKRFGLDSTRVRASVGEDDEWTHAELWLVPPGAEPPAAKAKGSIN